MTSTTQSRKPGVWGPIETAPKDHTPVLLRSPSGHTGIGFLYWSGTEEEPWLSGSVAWVGLARGDTTHSIWMGGERVTDAVAWASLPAPTEDGSQTEPNPSNRTEEDVVERLDQIMGGNTDPVGKYAPDISFLIARLQTLSGEKAENHAAHEAAEGAGYHARLSETITDLSLRADAAESQVLDLTKERDELKAQVEALYSDDAKVRALADADDEILALQAQLAEITKLASDYFEPWGSWKTAWWEGEVGEDKEFSGDNLLREIIRRGAARDGSAPQNPKAPTNDQ